MRGRPKIPTDLDGVIYISLDNPREIRPRVVAWAHDLRAQLYWPQALEEEQIVEIVHAMRRSKVPHRDIYTYMRRLDVLQFEVDDALAQG
jgi:hypothetical protein